MGTRRALLSFSARKRVSQALRQILLQTPLEFRPRESLLDRGLNFLHVLRSHLDFEVFDFVYQFLRNDFLEFLADLFFDDLGSFSRTSSSISARTCAASTWRSSSFNKHVHLQL